MVGALKVVESARQVARRRKLVTGLVAGGLAATVLAVGLAYWWSRRQREKPLHVPSSLPSDVHQQQSGYTFTRSDEGRRVFTVHAARTVAFKQGGTTVLEDVFVEFFGPAGDRSDALRTHRCDYSAQSGDLYSSGKVEIELNAQADQQAGISPRRRSSVHLETSKLSFRQKGWLVVSEEPVRFRIGPVAGSARGMAYATKKGRLELKNDISAELWSQGSTSGQPPLRLAATRARYDKQSREVLLWGPVEFSQGGRRAVGERGRVFLDKENRITHAVLASEVHATESSDRSQLEGSAQELRGEFEPLSGALRLVTAVGNVMLASRQAASITRLAAQEIRVGFAGAKPRPENGSAAGNVRLEIESMSSLGDTKPGGENLATERKELTTAEVRFTFQANGRSLREAHTAGAGKLVIVAADPRLGEREVTAGQFLMAFDTRNRLESLRGVSGTEIVFHPSRSAPSGTPPATTSSERLEATFDPATQALRRVQQMGNFQFREGDRQASATQADYASEAQILTLAGSPLLWDSQTRTRADRIFFNLRADTAEGVGKVQSTHFGNGGRSQADWRGEPINVLADRVVAQRESELVHYEGNVRVWHGQDVVESSSLDVYRKERRVGSGFRVLTSHLQPASRLVGQGSTASATSEKRPVTIRADRLEYFDEGRKASYRGNVQLRAENTTLQAERIDVYFLSVETVVGSQVERAVGDGQVRVEQPGRRATGQHAEYFANEGKILLSGGPPTLYDVEKGFTTGRRLTFFIHDDSLLVEGGDESRTLSRHRIAQ